MPKRISKTKQPRDVNQLAHRLVEMSTADVPPIIEPSPMASAIDVSRIMALMGRKGGQIGGKLRLQTMTAVQRSKVAKKAAKARWKKTKNL